VPLEPDVPLVPLDPDDPGLPLDPPVSTQRPTLLQRSEQQSVFMVHVEPETTHGVDASGSTSVSGDETPTHSLFLQTRSDAQSLSTWHVAVSELQLSCICAMTAPKTRAKAEAVAETVSAYFTSFIVAPSGGSRSAFEEVDRGL
jgi:hypothetical protein